MTKISSSKKSNKKELDNLGPVVNRTDLAFVGD
jgi:hypothetical protein